MSEQTLLKKLRMAASKLGARLFRNNTGVAWTGRVQRVSVKTNVTLTPGDLVIRKPRRLHAGLTKGSADLIGWKSLTVTESMIGKRIAVFTAVEAKTGRQKATHEQQNFINQVIAAGGIAFIARSDNDIEDMLGGENGNQLQRGKP